MKNKKLVYIVIFIIATSIQLSYFFLHYRVAPSLIKSISFESGFEKHNVVIYSRAPQQAEVDFSKPIDPDFTRQRFIYEMPGSGVRDFRIYFEREFKNEPLGNVTLHFESQNEVITFSQFKKRNLSSASVDSNNQTLISGELNSYIEQPFEWVTKTELMICLLCMVFISLATLPLITFIIRFYLRHFNTGINFTDKLTAVFFSSIFLPQYFFNLSFTLSFLVLLRNFNARIFKHNIAGILVLLYYFLFLTVYFFNSDNPIPYVAEATLPLLVVPFYTACIKGFNQFKLFPLSAMLIGTFLVATSAIEALLHHNIHYFSFDLYSKYLHPVYFSYYLAFCLIFIETNNDYLYSGSIFRISLLGFLMLCGSKLIIGFIALFYLVTFFKRKTSFSVVIIFLVFGISVFLFKPTRERFTGLFKVNIPGDLRVQVNGSETDGITLRWIIWQETLNTINEGHNLITGVGYSKKSYSDMKLKLEKRGLVGTQLNYDPHNQYLTTLYRTGLAGLILLLALCFYCFYHARVNKNSLLFYTTLLFCLAMCTESLLQRVTGICFFTSVLLLLINYSNHPTRSDNFNTK